MRRVAAALVVGLACLVASSASAGAGHPRVAFMAWRGDTPASPLVADFLRALRRTHVRGQVVFANPHKDDGGTLAYLAQQHVDLVIMGSPNVDAVPAVAFDFPKVRFLLPTQPHAALRDQVRALRPDASAATIAKLPRNVEGTDYRTEEAGYLAGYLAALVEERRAGPNVVAWVGGEPVPGVDRWAAGYAAGARHADPKVTILHAYSRDFGDTAKCRAIARRQIARGAGVVFDVAGHCGLGALEAAREEGVWGIGIDEDLSSLGPHVLASAVVHVDAGLRDALASVRRGTFTTGGDRSYGLREGGVELVGISPEVPRTIVARLDAVRRAIVAGSIGVPRVDPTVRRVR